MIFLNIITPCSRPYNLIEIGKSINIPISNYRWIVVFDSENLPDLSLIPKNCEFYTHKDLTSIYGNAQRNYALDLIDNGYIYFNDDDTVLHNDLWENIKLLDKYDFISFDQLNTNGSHRIHGNKIALYHIDSHNFITHHSLSNNVKFMNNNYCADGLFAEYCYTKAKNPIYINKYLSVYNQLRPLNTKNCKVLR